MSFFRFVFSFLYTRNWHTGQMELSRPRLMVFGAFLLLILVAMLMIAFLQIPIEYKAK
jgi:hypothetical protein